jgi:hypothetical protein
MKKTFVFIVFLICSILAFSYFSFKQAGAPSVLNLPLAQKLGQIHQKDQEFRRNLDSIRTIQGDTSAEFLARLDLLRGIDSSNLAEVSRILDSSGFLGSEVVGTEGSDALFLVIQHSDLATQEKYLPVFRKAVEKNQMCSANLALLEDRVLVGKGQPQIYGSQIGYDNSTGRYFLLPLRNAQAVDSLRRQVDLEPLSNYLAHWDIKWDTTAKK